MREGNKTFLLLFSQTARWQAGVYGRESETHTLRLLLAFKILLCYAYE